MKTSFILAAIAAFIPCTSSADSALVAAAKRERARREENRRAGIEPVCVVTQDDVKTNTSASGSWSDTQAAEPADARARSRGEERTWRARARAVRTKIEAARRKLASTPPTRGKKGEPNPAHAEAVRRLKYAEADLAELEDEARRSGALPGWLR